MTALTAFTTQLDNFLFYLSKQFPTNNSIKTYHNSINLIKKINPRQVILFFKQYIYIYKEKIDNEDASFFLEKEYNEELKNNNESMLEVIKFKDLWKNSNDKQKKQVFRYFQLLCLLSENYAL